MERLPLHLIPAGVSLLMAAIPNTHGELLEFCKMMLLIFRIFMIAVDIIYPLNHFVGEKWSCYIKKRLPTGSSPINQQYLLDNMDWSLLPIEKLWPLISQRSEFDLILLGHCNQFELEQLIWIAKNDRQGLKKLLSNNACVERINWYGLDKYSYQRYFSQLPVYRINRLDHIEFPAVLFGLRQIDFHLPTYTHQASFLIKLIEEYIEFLDFLATEPFAFDLFSVNAYLKMCDSGHLHNYRLTYLLAFFLKAKPANELITSRHFEAHVAYQVSLAEFIDFIQTSQSCHVTSLLRERLSALQSKVAPFDFTLVDEFDRGERILITDALNRRDLDFFLEQYQMVLDYFSSHPLGPFDQERLLQILLPIKNSSAEDFFFEVLERGHLSRSLLTNFLLQNLEISAQLMPLSLKCPLLMRILCLQSNEYSVSASRKPLQVPELLQADDFEILFEAATQILHFREFFKHASFAIEFDHQPVVDLGGPLLDWIYRLLEAMKGCNLFTQPQSASVTSALCPAPFLPLQWFQLLGLLHGKLLQNNSQPPWKLAFDETLSIFFDPVNVPNVAEFFNEMGFRHFSATENSLNRPPQLLGNYDSPHLVQVDSVLQIHAYFESLHQSFEQWKSLGKMYYRTGLTYFIQPNVDDQMLDRMLTLQPKFTPQQLQKMFQIHPPQENPSIMHFRAIWYKVMESFSPEDMRAFLVFTTGQCTSMFNSLSIDVHFILTADANGRLPHAKTCTKQLFIYCTSPQPDPLQIKQQLLFSIHNYQGFGHI